MVRHIDTLVNTFNSFHSRLKFTNEIGRDRLDFLDISLIKKRNSLVKNWYHKPTFSGRYLNYFSRHPLCQKVGTIVGLIDRVLSLSHSICHQENFELIIKILLNNGYPLKLIFSEIKNRLSKKFKQWNDQDNTRTDKSTILSTDNNEDKINKFFTITFIPLISEKIKKFFKKDFLINMAYKGINNLRRFIRGYKDIHRKLSL
ncbi:hypothetical protein ALC56_02887 [Trachymyrmex septentrionalis]|uniref:Helix-turn-helix domain-containing protein n=1 Tax=Trachymyrmex septentrionalis TaxID=34720 RepID=A0A151K003_9HYME|nr:hypothetical protein ALC56_02887 [Trachymyrmex septentrionalis]